MGGVLNKPSLVLKRGLEPVEHGVKRVREALHLVLGTGQADPPREVGGGDVPGNQGHALDRTKRGTCQQPADTKRYKKQHAEGRERRRLQVVDGQQVRVVLQDLPQLCFGASFGEEEYLGHR